MRQMCFHYKKKNKKQKNLMVLTRRAKQQSLAQENFTHGQPVYTE